MNLGDLIDNLTEGPLRNLGFVEEDQTVDPSFRPTLINHINKGLTRLYTRFVHERAFVTVEIQEDLQEYSMSKLFAVTDATPGNTNTRYIKDSVAAPYDGNLVKILSVKELGVDDITAEDDPDNDEEVLIGTLDGRRDGIRMLTYNKFFVRKPEAGRLLRVEYQKRHTPIDKNEDDTFDITLFPTLEEALEMYVAGRVYTAIGGEENMGHGVFYFREYERICNMSKAEDMTADSESNQSHRFANSGLC